MVLKFSKDVRVIDMILNGINDWVMSSNRIEIKNRFMLSFHMFSFNLLRNCLYLVCLDLLLNPLTLIVHLLLHISVFFD